MKKNLMNVLKLTALSVAAVTVFAACGQTQSTVGDVTDPAYSAEATPSPTAPAVLSSNPSNPGVPVAMMNGIEISSDDVNFMMQQAMFIVANEYFDIHGHVDVDEFDEFMDGVTIGRAVREEAVRQATVPMFYAEFGLGLGIYNTAEDLAEISENIDLIAAQWSAEEFAEIMENDGIRDREHLERLLQDFSIMDRVTLAIIEDDYLFSAFADYLLEYEFEIVFAPQDDEVFGAMHILAVFDNFASDEETRAFAEEMLERALAGEDFAMLVAEYGQDPGMMMNPEGYSFVSGVMVPEFEEATQSLAIGEISDLVRTNFGYHIIMRVEPNYDDVMRPMAFGMPNREETMSMAIHRRFEAMAQEADIQFLPALDSIEVDM